MVKKREWGVKQIYKREVHEKRWRDEGEKEGKNEKRGNGGDGERKGGYGGEEGDGAGTEDGKAKEGRKEGNGRRKIVRGRRREGGISRWEVEKTGNE